MNYRSNDMETSVLAGKRAAHAADGIDARIVGLLRQYPGGVTTNELSEISGIKEISVSPRIAPLRRKGLIFSDSKRRNPSGSMAAVWRLVPQNDWTKVDKTLSNIEATAERVGKIIDGIEKKLEAVTNDK